MDIPSGKEKQNEWFSYCFNRNPVCLGAGYLLYGRWLANKWGLDAKAKTPAFTP